MTKTENAEIRLDDEVKNSIIDKLIEDEKKFKNGERVYSREEMNAILDWTLNRIGLDLL